MGVGVGLFGFGVSAVDHLNQVEFIEVLGFGFAWRSINFGEAVVAVFLQGEELLVDAAEQIDDGLQLGKVGFNVLAGSHLTQEQFGDADGRGLQADFSQVGGVFVAVMFQEIVLPEGGLKGVVIKGGPFGVAAVSDPVGDVPFSEFVTQVVASLDDSFIGDMAGEHAADHVTHLLGQRSNGTGAGSALEERGAGSRERRAGSRSRRRERGARGRVRSQSGKPGAGDRVQRRETGARNWTSGYGEAA